MRYLTDRLGNLYIVDATTGVKITSKNIGQYNLSAPTVSVTIFIFHQANILKLPTVIVLITTSI